MKTLRPILIGMLAILMVNGFSTLSYGQEVQLNEAELSRLINSSATKQMLAKKVVDEGRLGVNASDIIFDMNTLALDPFTQDIVVATVDFLYVPATVYGTASFAYQWVDMQFVQIYLSYWLWNTVVSNDISTDTTWTPAGSPYYVTEGVTIYDGVTLTIKPGTVVKFRKFTNPQERIELWVSGDGDGGTLLLQQGPSVAPVRFTTSCDFEDYDESQSLGWETSDWGGLRTDCNGNIILDNTVLEYANMAVSTWERDGEVTVTNNTIRKCSEGVYSWGGGSSVTIVDNTISDCSGDAINVEFWEPNLGGDIAGNTITTNPDSHPCSVVYVNGGIPDVSGNVITGCFDHGISADCLEPSAVIVDNTINSPDDQSWRGINVCEGEYTISNNEITGSFDSGICICGSNGVITENTITSPPGSSSWAGIDCCEGEPTIVDNTIEGYFDVGVYVCDVGPDGVVSENAILGPTDETRHNAIEIQGGEPTVSDNYIEGGFGEVIYVVQVGSAGVVSGNTIDATMLPDPLGHAIKIIDGDSTVEANLIYGTFDQIIRVEEESTATITNHCLTGGNYGVYCVSSEPQIHNNSIQDNTEFGVYNETCDTQVYAEDNWWGAADGPSGEGPGSGDRVSCGVEFDPWLTTPPVPCPLSSVSKKQTAFFALSQNYPNPFNPETWIPYQLKEASDVTISIYDISGKLIRRLEFGHQPAGRYITKDKAAYWNGRNQIGEKVSSGIYFYQIQAGSYSAIKQMLILK